MNELIKQFDKSLVLDTKDILIDFVELGIDNIFENSALKEIPIINVLIGTGKFINDIRERNFAKNVLVFIGELNNGDISKDNLNRHIKELENDNKRMEKELSFVMILLDKTIDNRKSILFAKLYKAYITKLINWDTLEELSEVTNKLFINDLEKLKQIQNGLITNTTGRDDVYQIDRLNSIGLVDMSVISTVTFFSWGGQNNQVRTSKLGKQYFEIVFGRPSL